MTGKGFLGSAWSNTYFVRYYIAGLVQSKLAHTIYTQRFLLEVSFSKDNEVFEVSNFFCNKFRKKWFSFFFLGWGHYFYFYVLVHTVVKSASFLWLVRIWA